MMREEGRYKMTAISVKLLSSLQGFLTVQAINLPGAAEPYSHRHLVSHHSLLAI